MNKCNINVSGLSLHVFNLLIKINACEDVTGTLIFIINSTIFLENNVLYFIKKI